MEGIGQVEDGVALGDLIANGAFLPENMDRFFCQVERKLATIRLPSVRGIVVKLGGTLEMGRGLD